MEHTTAKTTVKCGDCNMTLDELPNETARKKCPSCGSVKRAFFVDILDEAVIMHEQIAMKARRPNSKGKQEIRLETKVGDDLYRKTGKWYKLKRIIDREHDKYFEEIIDPATGNVVRRYEELLSKHLGHGSDKPLM